MDLSVDYVKKMFILTPRAVNILFCINRDGKSKVGRYEGLNPNMMLELEKHGAVVLERSKKRIETVKITKRGKRLLEMWELLKTATHIEVRYKPCKACRRSDGSHTMMCPVGLGIMRD